MAIANDDSRTGGQSYKATVYQVIAKTNAQMIEPSRPTACIGTQQGGHTLRNPKSDWLINMWQDLGVSFLFLFTTVKL